MRLFFDDLIPLPGFKYRVGQAAILPVTVHLIDVCTHDSDGRPSYCLSGRLDTYSESEICTVEEYFR